MDETDEALSAHIAGLAELLAKAAKYAAEAAELMIDGKRTNAFIALRPIEKMVPEAQAALDATYALYRKAQPR